MSLSRPVLLKGGGERPRMAAAPGRDWFAVLGQGATVLGIALVLSGLISLMAKEPSDLLPLLALGALGAGAVIWGVKVLAEPQDYGLVLRFAVAGMVLRLGLAMVIHFNLPEWFFAPDQVTYADVGWRTLQYHRGLGPIPAQLQDTTEVGHFYWNAFLFFIFGQTALAPKIVNAFVGTFSALLAYRLGGELAGKDAARFSLALSMFFPSLVLWSALNLRDPIVLLATLCVFLSMVRFRSRPRTLSLLAVFFGVAVLFLFRDYMAVMVVFGLLGSVFITTARGLPANLFMGGVLFLLAALAYQQFGLGADWLEVASFEALATQRGHLAFGGTAFQPSVDISTPLRSAQYLPVGLAFFLLSPFPWQFGSMLSLMTLPEQIIWYSLFPAVAVGGTYLMRARFQVFGPTVLFLMITTGIYALVEGNAGTAYRHRAQVLIFFLIIAAVGMAVRKVRKAGGKV